MADSLFENNDNTARSEIEAKWKDKPAEELLKAKVDSDLYIKTLEKQKDELRNDYLKLREEANAQAKLQELLDKLEKASTNQVTPPVNEEKIAQYNPKDVESLVSDTIRKEKLQDQMTINFNTVKGKLLSKYGENYASQLQEQAGTLGLTTDELNEMARTRPMFLIKALGLDEPVQREMFQSPIRSSQRNDTFAPRSEKRTWNYYQNLKKSNPTAYYNKKTQFQMHQDSADLGKAFEDGDFNAL